MKQFFTNKATSNDLDVGTPDKWVDALGMKNALDSIGGSISGFQPLEDQRLSTGNNVSFAGMSLRSGSNMDVGPNSTVWFNNGSDVRFNGAATQFVSGASAIYNSNSAATFNNGSTGIFNSGSVLNFNRSGVLNFNTGIANFNRSGIANFNSGSVLNFNRSGVLNFNTGIANFNRSGIANFNSGSSARFNNGGGAVFNSSSQAIFNTDSSAQFENGSVASFRPGSQILLYNGVTVTLDGTIVEKNALQSSMGFPPEKPLVLLAGSSASTLQDGDGYGQKLTLVLADNTAQVVTPQKAWGFTSITFHSKGNSAILQYCGSQSPFYGEGWVILSLNGATKA